MSLGVNLALTKTQVPVVGASYNAMDQIVSSALIDIEATISDSYGGSGQTITDLLSGTNFTLGADASAGSDDPTFNGSAGDSGAYFSTDGGDFFKALSNISILNGAHKTGGTDSGPVWFAIAFRTPSSFATQAIFGTSTSSNDQGFRVITLSSGAIRLQQSDGSGFGWNASFTPTLSTDTDYVLIVSWDATSSGDTKIWLNSDTSSTTSDAFDATTTDATNVFELFANGGGGLILGASRFRGFSAGNEVLDNTKAADLKNEYEARHGLAYA